MAVPTIRIGTARNPLLTNTVSPLVQLAQGDGTENDLVTGLDPVGGQQGTQDIEVVDAQPKLATDHLGGDQQRGQGADASEHAESDGFGLDGPFGLGLDGRDGVGRERPEASRKDPGDLTLYGNHVLTSTGHLEGRRAEVDAAVEERLGQCGCEDQDVGVVAGVGVVFDHGRGLDHDADKTGGEATVGGHRSRAERRQVGLRIGVDAEVDQLVHMESEDPGRGG